jgi:glycosyltransferase involved in cell wall biosynthesis
MKLLYVIDSLVPGGAESSLAAMAPRFIESGVELDVAYLRNRPGLQRVFETAGAATHCLEARGRAGWIRRIRRLIADRNPDLVHTTLFEADICGRVGAKLARKPVVTSLVNVAYGPEQLSDPSLRPWKVRASQLLDITTGRGVKRWHALTSHVADVMGHRLRIDPSSIDVIPRGRDADALGMRTPDRRARGRLSLGVTRDTPVVVAASRQERQKGLDVLIHAWPGVVGRVPDARLFIAGREGNQTSELHEIATRLRLDDSITFLGARDDVPDLLCAADTFAFPSRWEGLGSVLLEAMALEVPLVASDLSPIRETVRDGFDAILVPSEAPDSLAPAIVELLLNREKAERMARNGRQRFLALYTIERVAESMLSFYDRALEEVP